MGSRRSSTSRFLVRWGRPFCRLAFATVWIVSSIAHAAPTNEEARQQLEIGQRAYKEGDYAAATAAFEKGFEIENDPSFLYAWAQAERQRGDCRGAVRLYQRYLATDPSEIAARYAKDSIVRCAGNLADEPEEDPEDPEDPEEAKERADPFAGGVTLEEPPRERRPDEPKHASERPGRVDARPWYRDAVGAALVGSGLGVGVAGGGLLIGALFESRREGTYEEFSAQVPRVRGLQIAGVVTLGVGAAMLSGGTIRWIVLASRARKQRSANVSPRFVLYGTGLGVRGRF